MSLFKRARAAIAALIGNGAPALPAAAPVESVKPVELPDAKKVVTDYQYWRDLFGNRKRRRGYSAKSPQWYGWNCQQSDGLNRRLTRADGIGSYDYFKKQQAVDRAARKLLSA